MDMDEFLNDNPDYLSDYVLNNVSTEQIERWLIRKNRNKKSSLSRYKFCVHADKRKMLQSLTNMLSQDTPQRTYVLNELSATIASAVNASHWHLFLIDWISQSEQVFEVLLIVRGSAISTCDVH
ncbi:unnamed protein product [Oppiella nova]|uniref:Uncharacterized protein n=1 Tax=Oppiella nova TaxID=334625 RepID=A0A7R9M1R3_9ACAR|nr:unnamed protein product [Oppiella nova]CAG2169108.1 unnamed protein product [Oppiella nova]